MRLPAIEGVIRRRILVNFRVDPEVIQRVLPPRFRPKFYSGYAVAGICLIRLEHIHPKGFPAMVAVSSENAAHRIAVTWHDENGQACEGVFIPRRDTNSQMNYLLGGRLFPGEHHRADFTIAETEGDIALSMSSRDRAITVEVEGTVAQALPRSSIFPSLPDASAFFECGSLGYSVTRDSDRLDGLKLVTKTWRVEPLEVAHVYSSFFGDERMFPKGSVEFDDALIMRNNAHEWHSAKDLYM